MRRLRAKCMAMLLVAALTAGAAWAQLPTGVRLDADLAYGSDPDQRLDVYLPPAMAADAAPVLLMVHGGGWRRGSRSASRVVDAKLTHWVGQRGFVLVSVDYRLVPQVNVLQQAQDVARALAFVQQQAPRWGADPDRVVLMGHSAGAHLVALLGAAPALARAQGARDWRGTVALDSAALDTVALMRRRHLPLYDKAFGDDPAWWPQVSPTARLGAGATPFLLVCSAPRRDDACGQSQAFAEAVRAVGAPARVLPQPLGHGDINAELGVPGAYTEAVDQVIAGWVAPRR